MQNEISVDIKNSYLAEGMHFPNIKVIYRFPGTVVVTQIPRSLNLLLYQLK